MYIVAISGSPRKEGNTTTLVRQVIRHLDGRKRFISLAGLDINPCQSCDTCWKEQTDCVIADDIRWILKELERCDVMIFGSPCYFKSVSAQLKMLMDRTLSLYGDKKLKNKIGAAVVTHEAGGWAGALVLHSLIDFFNTHGVIYAGGVIGEGGEEEGHVRRDRDALDRARALAQRIAELGRLLRKR